MLLSQMKLQLAARGHLDGDGGLGLREGGTALRTDDLALGDVPLDLTLLVAGEVKGGTSERTKEGQAGLGRCSTGWPAGSSQALGEWS
jgi:hypothetical protein